MCMKQNHSESKYKNCKRGVNYFPFLNGGLVVDGLIVVVLGLRAGPSGPTVVVFPAATAAKEAGPPGAAAAVAACLGTEV